MDRGVWQATVHGVVRVGHNLATKPPPPVVRTQHFHCQGSGSTAGRGTKIPQIGMARKKKTTHGKIPKYQHQHNRSLKEVDTNPHGWLWVVQGLSGERDGSCGIKVQCPQEFGEKNWSLYGRLSSFLCWFRLLRFSLRNGAGEERVYFIYFVKGNFSLPLPFFFPSNPSA